jgi:hypothetical protein
MNGMKKLLCLITRRGRENKKRICFTEFKEYEYVEGYMGKWFKNELGDWHFLHQDLIGRYFREEEE